MRFLLVLFIVMSMAVSAVAQPTATSVAPVKPVVALPVASAAKPEVAKAVPAGQPAASQPVDPKDVQEAVGMVKTMVDSFKAGGAGIREGIAILISLILFVWRKFGSRFIIGKLSKWWLTFLTLFAGMIGALPVALMAPSFVWWKFIIDGFVMGAEAMAFWALVVKKIPGFAIADEKKKETTVATTKPEVAQVTP